jgi:hypothetical protein
MSNELYRDFIDRELTVIDNHIVDIINLLGNVVVLENATGNPVSFNTSLTMPLVQCKSLISGYQEGTGTPSPSNIRNIVSFSEGILTANNDTYTFTFGENIYRGYIDWLNGKVIANYVVIDLGSLTWYHPKDSIRFIATISDIKLGMNGLCSSYPLTSTRGIDKTLYMFDGYYGGRRIAIFDSDYTDASLFTAAVTGQKLAYELATPMEISLTPAQIKSIIGLNSIASNTGDLDVKFLALATD